MATTSVGAHVHDNAAVAAAVAPAVGHVAGADRRHVAGLPSVQGQAVEVAAVLGGQLAQERRPPQRREAVALAEGGQAAEAAC